MSVSRLDLDEVGSASGLAAKIHELCPDLSLDFDIEALCRQLDIDQIKRIDTHAFAAALVTDENKAFGSILLSSKTGRRRARFSIGHELGHFLMPSHMPREGQSFACLADDLRLGDAREQDRARRKEAEANKFAAELLMPAAKVKSRFASLEPDLVEVARLADAFDVSKGAMLRRYIDLHPAELAAVVLQWNRVVAIYRPNTFPWIEAKIGQLVPVDSIAHAHELAPGSTSEVEECDLETWLNDYSAKNVEVLCEQVAAQQGGFSTVLLLAELAD
ncbi:ImmA/IrrE family metallo-endopeptidase [Sphingomonas flavescens]|uniref:ImmA/IrrE family metallo-endopeptidase n=1 Tax=Sphingomonas flavescens TaxID=3132797 RepID=UPI0028038A94|nr:ImmA/IrrE family metallo-endopeptidase [Sphingomonas limnosediminicola]